MVQAEEIEQAREAAETLARVARREIPDIPDGARVELLGPAPAPIAKLRGRYRFMLLLKGDDEALVRRVSIAISKASKQLPRAVQSALDARPVNML